MDCPLAKDWMNMLLYQVKSFTGNNRVDSPNHCLSEDFQLSKKAPLTKR